MGKQSEKLPPRTDIHVEFGDPRVPKRFWGKVRRRSNGCWIWVASLNAGGYGRVKYEGRTWRAHRLIYALCVDPTLPSSVHLDHHCNARACVNPTHLSPKSNAENVARGVGVKHSKLDDIPFATCRKPTCSRCGRRKTGIRADYGKKVRYCLPCHREDTRKSWHAGAGQRKRDKYWQPSQLKKKKRNA